jgi:tripartite-type tricarboxylate transporter receptor subunit TctC
MTLAFSRRSFGRTFASALALALTNSLAAAAAPSSFPAKPITIVVPFSPGGGTDALARAVGAKMQQSLGQPVIVDNRPGAGGTIGAGFVARAPADGYTLLILNVLPHTASTGLYKNLSFDPVKSFASVGLIGSTPYVVTVNPSVPARNLKELVSLAKSKPGSINYGSSGVGGVSHLSTELFKKEAGVDFTHVPYKGDGPVVTDLIAGQIQLTLGNVVAMLPHIRAGKLRALAVTGDARMDILPEVPTVKESGYPGYSVVGQFGLAAPAGTPPEVMKRLNEALVAAVKSPDLVKVFTAQGVTPTSSSAEQMQALMHQQQQVWTKLVKEIGISAE